MTDEVVDLNLEKFSKILASAVENRPLVIGMRKRITKEQITEALMREFREHPDWDFLERLQYVKNRAEGALRLLGVNDESVIAFYVNYFRRELADREEIIDGSEGGEGDSKIIPFPIPIPKK